MTAERDEIEEVKLLYPIVCDDIKFFKKIQITLITSTIWLYIAIYAVNKYFIKLNQDTTNSLQGDIQVLLFCIASFLAVVSLITFINFSFQISKSGKRLGKFRKIFFNVKTRNILQRDHQSKQESRAKNHWFFPTWILCIFDFLKGKDEAKIPWFKYNWISYLLDFVMCLIVGAGWWILRLVLFVHEVDPHGWFGPFYATLAN